MSQFTLGYACICMDLREAKPSVFTSRSCTKKTLEKKGVDVLGEIALKNCRDLLKILQWNEAHNIRFFRMSSDIWPWMGVHDVQNFAEWPAIERALQEAGEFARIHDHRLTFHPSHFVKLAALDTALASLSLAEMEAHSLVLDTMGFCDASPQNKINIHVGGVYGDKQSTMIRWAERYAQLSSRCRARVTIENDDTPNGFNVDDLLELHAMCGVPIVFDFHHWKFNKGSKTMEDAFRAALTTWPHGIRPVVHWSESQEGRKPHAHSDLVDGPIDLFGLEAGVDVMIEAKHKERALLRYRELTI